MADGAIQHIKQLKEIAPDKPFFVYYVPGATHAPHHPTPEWIKKISEMQTTFANQNAWASCPRTRSYHEAIDMIAMTRCGAQACARMPQSILPCWRRYPWCLGPAAVAQGPAARVSGLRRTRRNFRSSKGDGSDLTAATASLSKASTRVVGWTRHTAIRIRSMFRERWCSLSSSYAAQVIRGRLIPSHTSTEATAL